MIILHMDAGESRKVYVLMVGGRFVAASEALATLPPVDRVSERIRIAPSYRTHLLRTLPRNI